MSEPPANSSVQIIRSTLGPYSNHAVISIATSASSTLQWIQMLLSNDNIELKRLNLWIQRLEEPTPLHVCRGNIYIEATDTIIKSLIKSAADAEPASYPDFKGGSPESTFFFSVQSPYEVPLHQSKIINSCLDGVGRGLTRLLHVMIMNMPFAEGVPGYITTVNVVGNTSWLESLSVDVIKWGKEPPARSFNFLSPVSIEPL